MNIKNLKTTYDINSSCPPGRIVVSHDCDVNTRTVEVRFRQGVIPLAISQDCTAKAAFVERQTNILINDNVPCTVTESGSVLIPVDNLHRQGRFDMSIELTVTNQSGEQVLATPFPMWITVNGSILNEAEVTEESKGTVSELLEEAAEALDLAGIESGEVNENGAITFTRPNGTTFTTTGESVIGKQGNSVTNAEILNNDLIIHIGVFQPDGTILDTPINVGRVVGQTGAKGDRGTKGESITRAYRDSMTHHLMLRHTVYDENGTAYNEPFDVGAVDGKNGNSLQSVSINNNGELIFTIRVYTDINTYSDMVRNLGRVVGADGQNYVLTPQDKTDIANIVLQLLPTTQGVLYGNTSN